MTHQYIQLIGEELISKLYKLPAFQQDPHHGVCVYVCLYLPWEDKSLSGSIFLIALIVGITRGYWPVG